MGAAAGFDLVATFTGDPSLRGAADDADPAAARRRWARAGSAATAGGCRWRCGAAALRAITYRPARAVGAGEVGGAAGGAERRRRHRGDRGRAHARPHRADADARSAARSRSRTATTAATSASPAASGWSARAIRVPGDPSSAAFPLVAALITPGSARDGRGRAAQSAARRPLRHPAGDGRGPLHRERARGGRRARRRRHRAPFAAQGGRRAARARALDDRRISDPRRRGGLRRGPDGDARHRRAAGQGERPHRHDGGGAGGLRGRRRGGAGRA